MSRHYSSGATKRKNKEIREAKSKELMGKIRKLDVYFETAANSESDFEATHSDDEAPVGEDMEIQSMNSPGSPLEDPEIPTGTSKSQLELDSENADIVVDGREMSNSENQGSDSSSRPSEVTCDYSDIALWPQPLSSDVARTHIVKNGPVRCIQFEYPTDMSGRRFSEIHYKRKLPNGEYM